MWEKGCAPSLYTLLFQCFPSCCRKDGEGALDQDSILVCWPCWRDVKFPGEEQAVSFKHTVSQTAVGLSQRQSVSFVSCGGLKHKEAVEQVELCSIFSATWNVVAQQRNFYKYFFFLIICSWRPSAGLLLDIHLNWPHYNPAAVLVQKKIRLTCITKYRENKILVWKRTTQNSAEEVMLLHALLVLRDKKMNIEGSGRILLMVLMKINW